MREIKFRQPIFDGNGCFKEWHYWGFIDDQFIGPYSMLYPNQQFTGLKDKNDKEIYEGDIVDNGTGKYSGVVTFENGSFIHRKGPFGFYVEDGIVPNTGTGEDVELEVCGTEYWAIVSGNLYQNHELL